MNHRVTGVDASVSESHRARYRGKSLAYLLLALALPTGLLYLRLVLGLAATDDRVTPSQSVWLARWSSVALLVFVVTQLVAAVYVWRMLPSRRSRIAQALQYLSVLLVCVTFSLTGMTVLEAFGLNLFIRTAGVR
ncbi:MAG: hypothetical protein M3Y24_10910 [Acidobacteriota bacterium]|nr:hypothetical protein [Acidobacteriota bacterium]